MHKQEQAENTIFLEQKTRAKSKNENNTEKKTIKYQHQKKNIN